MKRIMSLYIAIVLFLVGCRSKDCPDCSHYIYEYSPYKIGETVRFFNDNADTMELEIVDNRMSYKDKYRPTIFDCGCFMYTEMRNDSVKIEYDYTELDPNVMFYCRFYYCGSQSFVDVYMDELRMDNISDTIYLKWDDMITNAIIERGFGITEFKDSRKNCVWKLVR